MLRQDQTVVLPRCYLLYCQTFALDLLDKQRCRREAELPVVEPQLAVFVASNGEQLALLRKDESVGATAGHCPYQDVEAEALWHVHMPVSVVLGRVLPVAKLPIVVAALREVLSVSVHDLFIIFDILLFDFICSVVTIFFRNSIVFVCLAGRIGIATIRCLDFKRSCPRVWNVLELPRRRRPGAVAIGAD